MKGFSFVLGKEDSIKRLSHMFEHCLYRFENRMGCEGCEYNSDSEEKDVCELLEISIKIQKNTTYKDSGNPLIRLVK